MQRPASRSSGCTHPVGCTGSRCAHALVPWSAASVASRITANATTPRRVMRRRPPRPPWLFRRPHRAPAPGTGGASRSLAAELLDQPGRLRLVVALGLARLLAPALLLDVDEHQP